MSVAELSDAERPRLERGQACVIVVGEDAGSSLSGCLRSVLSHTPEEVPIVAILRPRTDRNDALSRLLDGYSEGARTVWTLHAQLDPQPPDADPLTSALNRALELTAPADAVLLSAPCLVTAGWLERLRDAATADTNIATASALADQGTELSIAPAGEASDDIDALAEGVAERSLKLRPRLSRAVRPCVYVRREALELAGPLDARLDHHPAVEIDLAGRCLLSGLSHVVADDVLVGLSQPHTIDARSFQATNSAVLFRALAAARGPGASMWVTIDARALDGSVTGTQVHILELIRALAATGVLRLRVIVRADVIDDATRELLDGLAQTEVLATEDIDSQTPRSAVFHRPQQAFSPGDVDLALALGERVVISQLDLIAYSNPGYFPDLDAWQDYRRASRHGMTAAERVIVFSEHTRADILAEALVEPERIRIVPPGLDHHSIAEPLRPAALAPDDLTEEPPFLLCLGTDFRHKNRLFALQLLDRLREHHGWGGKLVLAGSHTPHGSSLELEDALLTERPGLRPNVIRLGAVSEREKAWLIAHAEALVYPSVYEGFGLVPFEAALGGVVCLFAPQASLAEVAPQETSTIVPWDVVQSAERISELLGDPDARRRQIDTLARAARALTWTAAAESLIEIYAESILAPVRAAATLSRDAIDRERRIDAVHEVTVRRVEGERDRVQRSFEELIEDVGPGRSLVGPTGTMPDDLQRGLLALSARPALARPLFRLLGGVFALGRALDRATLRRLRGGHAPD